MPRSLSASSRRLYPEVGSLEQLNGLWWLLLLLGPLLFFIRRLHFEIQAVLLLLTRRVDVSTLLFALLFLPGVFLHEASHYLMARLLRVPTGRFSLVPQPLASGKLRMGFVETARTDLLRDALIGSAPLIAGGIVVAYLGIGQLGLIDLWGVINQVPPPEIPSRIGLLVSSPDFWLWFYLAFTVSSTMFPSSSDRRAWLPLLLVALLLLAIGLLFGAGPWLLANLGEPFNRALLAVDAVLGISLSLHLVLLLPTLALRLLLSRLTGYKIVSDTSLGKE